MTDPTLNVCLRTKRIYLNRVTITQLGDPTHLSFWYDEEAHLLYISATVKEDLDAYEIPKYFWKSSRSCEIARIAFLTALQYRLNWEDGSKYSYTGALIKREGFPAIVFNMTEGKSVKRHLRHTEARRQCSDGSNFADARDVQESDGDSPKSPPSDTISASETHCN